MPRKGHTQKRDVLADPLYNNVVVTKLINNIMLDEILRWMKHKLKSRLPGKISITSDRQMMPPLWQKVKKN